MRWAVAALVLALAAAQAGGAVARAVFTTGITGREPVDRVVELPNDQRRVYYFTELVGLAGQTVTHRWEYGGRVMAEVAFRVGGPRWRVWSSKNLLPQWTGEWRVAVVDEAGRVLAEDRFNYVDAAR
ncbi:DUF2914 domain-containing protein [Inmirania thermothiophila]|nr:DUF2914 domain-containing protein [Inmirania thermothiophila]